MPRNNYCNLNPKFVFCSWKSESGRSRSRSYTAILDAQHHDSSIAPSELSPSIPALSLPSPNRPLLYEQNYLSHLMSQAHPTASSSHTGNQASNFQLIINNALDAYKKRTKNDLLAHPLVTELQSCNSPSTIIAVLQQQVQGLDQSRRSDKRWTRWLDPTVNVLYALSGILGEGVSLVRLRT